MPEWNEHEGKADIRAHITWILEQLDREVYKDESGQEDMVKIKKDLEKWRQSKQLLQVVMKNQSIKVTCRKVTIDYKVTRGSYSWEQSNVWSGGENGAKT
jgi:superfamily I DNA and RNA helicase